jgi:hypothetical protein
MKKAQAGVSGLFHTHAMLRLPQSSAIATERAWSAQLKAFGPAGNSSYAEAGSIFAIGVDRPTIALVPRDTP